MLDIWTLYFCINCKHLQTFTFASLSPHLKSAPLHHTAPDKSSHNFFSRHAAIRHKFNEKSYENHQWKLDTFVCYAFKTLIVLLSHLVQIVHFIHKNTNVPKFHQWWCQYLHYMHQLRHKNYKTFISTNHMYLIFINDDVNICTICTSWDTKTIRVLKA